MYRKTSIHLGDIMNKGIREVPKKYDLSGKCFGKLKVIDRDKNTFGQETKWNCVCECGKKTIVRRSDLINLHTTSCGCSHRSRGNKHFNWKGFGEIPYSLWSSIKFGQKRKTKRLKFNITIKYIWDLFLKQNRKCALSGMPIEFTKFVNDSKKTTASLDRIDSAKGYTKGNIQWVHKTINQMKMDFSQDEFIYFCKAVAKRN